jgi:hypothetical protein
MSIAAATRHLLRVAELDARELLYALVTGRWEG